MQKRYRVKLTLDERLRLEGLVKKGKHSAACLTKARILLLADESCEEGRKTDAEISGSLSLQKNRAERVRQVFVEEGLERVLERKKREAPPVPPIFDGEKEARLIALACSEPPLGRARWTLQLLADKLVELKILDSVSDDTVRLALKKTNLSLTLRGNG